MTGKDIKIIRNKLLLLQEEMADELGVSIATIRLWEQGKREMSIRKQRLVLEYCKNKGIEI
jgi:DNA-binding transcriptional regulator YiaG